MLVHDTKKIIFMIMVLVFAGHSYAETKMTLVKGDITKQHFDDPSHTAIVNAANAIMLGGGGIDGAIHYAAGLGLVEECRAFPVDGQGHRCPVGQAKITGGHKLAPLKIIHTVGPDTRTPVQNSKREALLASAYRTSLDIARAHNITHIAFPAISTAIYAYPIQEATFVAIKTVREYIALYPESFIEIRFVTFSDHDYDVYLKNLVGPF